MCLSTVSPKFLMVAGCNYIRATCTSCCYLCWNVCWNHYRIFQWNSLSNVWFSQCLPACRVFLGLCVKLQTCRVITSVWENLQWNRKRGLLCLFPSACFVLSPNLCSANCFSSVAVWMEGCTVFRQTGNRQGSGRGGFTSHTLSPDPSFW